MGFRGFPFYRIDSSFAEHTISGRGLADASFLAQLEAQLVVLLTEEVQMLAAK